MKLKSVIFCLSFLLFGAAFAISPDVEHETPILKGAIEDLINGTLNKLLDGLDDPLSIPEFSTNFNNAILTGDVSISNLSLTGVKSILASFIKVRILKPSSINVTISVPKIQLFTDYDLTLIVGQLLPFYGKGNISLNLEGLSFDFYSIAELTILPPAIKSVSNVSLEFYVGKDTTFSITGLMKNEEFTNLLMDLVNEFLPRIIDFLDTNKDRVGRVVSWIIQYILDNIIKVDVLTIDNFNKEIDSSFYPEVSELGGDLVKEILGVSDITNLLLLLNETKR